MIAIIHAFSRRNAGDSLLVDLALERLERAGIPRRDCCVFALDASSFDDLPCVERVPGEPWGRISSRLVPALGEVLGCALSRCIGRRLFSSRLARSLATADAFVAVGGGYLRTPTAVNSLGVLLNHVPQLAIVSGKDRPAIYLPQSVGPLPGPVGALTRYLLRDVDAVYVRDDRSLKEVGASLDAARMPDLAVLEIAERGLSPRSTEGTSRMVVVGRQLPSGEGYEDRLTKLGTALGDVEWAVQSTGLGGRSDSDFYQRLDVPQSGPLAKVLASGHGVVISVRLHGALQAILEGWPAIHLAYERKGWGGFQDLGIPEFVHPARTFEPSAVARQARSLAEDSRAYWRQIQEQIGQLRSASDNLQERLRGLAAHVAPRER